MARSIVQSYKECFFCKTTLGLHKHHIFGGINRKLSEKYGLWVYLCVYHHTGSNDSVHMNREIEIWLKRYAQIRFERKHTREEFIEIFGKSWR